MEKIIQSWMRKTKERKQVVYATKLSYTLSTKKEVKYEKDIDRYNGNGWYAHSRAK